MPSPEMRPPTEAEFQALIDAVPQHMGVLELVLVDQAVRLVAQRAAAAMEKYGRHALGCRSAYYETTGRPYRCDCGFDAILTSWRSASEGKEG